MNKKHEAFEAWFNSSRFANIGVGFNREEDMFEAWQARQAEVDALKAKIVELDRDIEFFNQNLKRQLNGI